MLQEGQQLIVCNQGLQGQMHAIITREIALHRAFYAQRRQLASMNTQTMDDKAQHQVTVLHRCIYCEAQKKCCHVSPLCMCCVVGKAVLSLLLFFGLLRRRPHAVDQTTQRIDGPFDILLVQKQCMWHFAAINAPHCFRLWHAPIQGCTLLVATAACAAC